MGSSLVKCLHDPRDVDDGRSVIGAGLDDGHSEIVNSRQAMDDQEIARLKRELERNPKYFILNQLLMSVMFYENFEKDKLDWSTHSEIRENIDKFEKITADVIFEIINRNVGFKRRHGEKKNKIETILPKRTYVVSDLIEVIANGNTYSAIDKSVCQVNVEESTHVKTIVGYVKLKCLENKATTDETLITEQKPGPSSAPDGEYAYTTITALNTPQLIKVDQEAPLRRITLPKFCYTNRQILNIDAIDESDDGFYEPQPKVEVYKTISYVNSSKFMYYFQSNAFPSSIGPELGFNSDEINASKSIIGKILCQSSNETFDIIPSQIVPGVLMPCPNISEFMERNDRNEVEYQGHKFVWITQAMMKAIKMQECFLIPKGFYPKKEKNEDSEIEWEISFPKAERLLDATLTHTKIRAFLLILLIHKTYIQPHTKHLGLQIEHIRTFMYWQFERKPRDWSEHGLGYKIIDLLTELNNHLSVNHLPDFFLRNKNIFQNIPKSNLQFAQQVFHRVIEAPVMYMIGALSHLKYVGPKFYPNLNWHALYKAVTVKVEIAMPFVPPNLQQRKPRRERVSGTVTYKKNIKMKMHQIETQRITYMENKRKEMEKQVNENLKDERKTSIDSLDFMKPMLPEINAMQTGPVLNIFIRQFIEMAKISRKISTQRQTLFLLKQAWYLAKVLAYYYASDAKDLLDEIKREELETMGGVVATNSSINADLPPSTPPRNSVQFNYNKHIGTKLNRNSSALKTIR